MMGGAVMYPLTALALALVLLGIATAATLFLRSAARVAWVFSGAVLAGGLGAVALGWVGYQLGMQSMLSALAHVNPDDKAEILAMGTQEALVAFNYGLLTGGPCVALGILGLAVSWTRTRSAAAPRN
jgi:hypothetical protein